MGVLAFILFGFVVGIIARAIMPGRQSMGLVATTLLGVAGAFLGGLIGGLIAGRPATEVHSAGLLGSILGASLILLLAGWGGRHHPVVP